MSAFIDLTGQRYSQLVVIERTQNKGNKVRWVCKCDCGATAIVSSHELRSGKTRSCGCLQRKISGEQTAKRNFKHGQTRTPLHNSWSGMIQRCEDSNYKWFKDYGARGVTVCPEWKDFTAFAKWAVASGYKPGLSLDRINVNGNYCPENCRWATDKEQANNRRTNQIVCYNGESKTIAEWAALKGVPYHTLWNRLRVRGWPVEKALSVPKKTREALKKGV